MAFLRAFGRYVPPRVAGNEELSARTGKPADWIREITGIEERRWAADEETVADMAARAAEDCLSNAGIAVAEIGLLIVASGSSPRRFPGPASSVGQKLGIVGVPALDIPLASAGSIYGLSLGSRLAKAYKNVLVVGAEKMSAVIALGDPDPNIDILFGDGAGACLVSIERGAFCVLDSVLHSDGTTADALQLPLNAPMRMDGSVVIRHASQKLPAVICEALQRAGKKATDVSQFIMHQANQNLIVRVAKTLGVDPALFFSNIARYGNTSSASMLIAAAEADLAHADTVCFAGFGAGFHWGALVAERVKP